MVGDNILTLYMAANCLHLPNAILGHVHMLQGGMQGHPQYLRIIYTASYTDWVFTLLTTISCLWGQLYNSQIWAFACVRHWRWLLLEPHHRPILIALLLTNQ